MNKKRSLLIAPYLALTALAILCAGPILIMMMTSFRTQAQTFTTGLSFFFAPMLENYRDVIFDSSFGRYLVNSLIAGIAATLLALLFGCMAAYGLARFSFAGRRTIACATLILRTVPLAMIAVPVFMVWSDWHLTDSLGGLILRYAAVNPPFIIWLFYGFVLQVPVDLEEAATIDGCRPWKVFPRIVLPLIRPGLAAAAIFTFRTAWNEFILAPVLTDRSTRTLSVAASSFVTDIGVEGGKLMAPAPAHRHPAARLYLPRSPASDQRIDRGRHQGLNPLGAFRHDRVIS